MWLFKYMRVFFSLLIIVSLCGCGFQPLYREHDKNSASFSTYSQFPPIKIKPIANREGHLLWNRLLDRLNPYGEPKKPTYFLHIMLEKSNSKEAIQKDMTATRSTATITATLHLRNADYQEVYRDETTVKSSYPILLNADLANLSLEETTEEHLLILLADTIVEKILLFLNRPLSYTQNP